MGRIKDILNTELFGTKKKDRKFWGRKRRSRKTHLQIDFVKIFAIFLGPIGPIFYFSKYKQIRDKRLLDFFRTIRMIVQNNAPLGSGLSAVADDAPNSYVRAVLDQLGEDIEQGASLSESLAMYSRVFPRIYVDLIEMAEETGQIGPALNNIIEDIETSSSLRSANFGTWSYIFTCLFTQALILTFLMIKVLPVFVEIFGDFGAQLPPYAMALGELVGSVMELPEHYAIELIIGFFAACLAIIVARVLVNRVQFCKAVWVWFLLLIPAIRQLVMARQRLIIVEGLEIHLKAHLPLAEAIRRVCETGIDPPYQKALQAIHDKLVSGHTVSDAFPTRSFLLGSTFGAVLSLGETAGTLPESCKRLRILFKNDLTRKYSIYSDALIPGYALIGGAINLWIILTMYSGVFGLSDVIINTL
jgi:type II secretory pathway component PulF